MARVVARELGREHSVAVAESVGRALDALESGVRFDAVIAAYRLDGKATAGKLFATVARRWPLVRRLCYADGARVHVNVRRLAHRVIVAGSFDDLLAAIGEPRTM